MTYVLVRHKVEDYGKWKIVFDEHGAVRKEMGSTGARVLRNLDDTDEQLIITEWPNLQSARAFAQSPSLREAMQRAGVVDRPDVFFLDEVDRQAA